MEKAGRHYMVADNLALNRFYEEKPIENPLSPTPLQYTSVSLSEVQYNKLRLEASAFNLNAKAAKSKVEHCLYGYVHLWGDDGLVKEAFVRTRFKRIYVEKADGIPFYQPSSITEIFPKPVKYISERTNVDIEALRVKKGMLLMTVSGTIGKCSIVSNSLENKVFSHDLLRLTGKNEHDTGYIYAFFSTAVGQQILQTNNYGAVIQHIEPEHLKNIIIPDAPESIKKDIHDLIITSFNLRDQSNDLIACAEKILYQELQLPPIEDLKPTYFDKTVDLRNYTTRLSSLNLRLDCSYHVPLIHLVEKVMTKYSKEIVTIDDISKNIILAGVFKRIYVDKNNGIPFLGGRDITQLNPQVEKYLSKTKHDNRIKQELEVFENYILISDRGTIGKVQIVPKHWERWAVSQNIIKVIPINNDIAGYLYCFLNSDYGQVLIKKEIYGSVIDMIDNNSVSKIKVPLLKNELKQQEINNMVLHANALRYQAYLKEQEAIKMMDDVIEGKIIRF